MATATITRGYAKWVLHGTGATIYDNSPSGNAANDWTIWVGRSYMGYTNDYNACVIAFTVPSILDNTGASRTLSISCKFKNDYGDIPKPLYAQLSTTAPTDYTSFNHGPTSGALSNEISFNESTTTLTFAINNGVVISGKTIYLYMYAKENAELYRVALMEAPGNGTLTYTEGGIVYIDNGTSFEAHQVYIDNGSSWDLYVPYIDNGSSWDVC